MSWAVEVIADDSGEWVGNAVRFATREEASYYASDLFSRWTLVRETRVVESPDSVNYAILDGRLVSIQRTDEA